MILIDRHRMRAFARFTLQRFMQERCAQAAGALAYTTLFALVPLIAVVLGILTAFPVFEQWRDAIMHFTFENFVPATGDVVQKYFTEFVASASKATAIGVVVLLFSAVSLMISVEDAFNRIWRVPDSRTTVGRVVMYWTVLTAGPVLLVTALAITSYLIALPFLAEADESFQVTPRLLSMLPFLIELFALTACYILIPHCRVNRRHAAIGAVVATVLFEAAKRGFAIYVTSGSGYAQVYGALAIVPIFIFWIYLSWFIVLVGASFAATMSAFEYRPDAPSLPPGDELLGLLRVFGHFAQAQQRGESLELHALVEAEPFLNDQLMQRYIGDLERMQFIARDERGDFVMIRDLSSVRLHDFYTMSGYGIPPQTQPLPPGDAPIGDTRAAQRLKLAAAELQRVLAAPLSEIFSSPSRSIPEHTVISKKVSES